MRNTLAWLAEESSEGKYIIVLCLLWAEGLWRSLRGNGVLDIFVVRATNFGTGAVFLNFRMLEGLGSSPPRCQPVAVRVPQRSSHRARRPAVARPNPRRPAGLCMKVGCGV